MCDSLWTECTERQVTFLGLRLLPSRVLGGRRSVKGRAEPGYETRRDEERPVPFKKPDSVGEMSLGLSQFHLLTQAAYEKLVLSPLPTLLIVVHAARAIGPCYCKVVQF